MADNRTQVDPRFLKYNKDDVEQILDGANTAYGWGDHAKAGYIVGELATDDDVRTALGLTAE